MKCILSIECPIWTIALPAYLHGNCAEVHIGESHVGIGGVTPELRSDSRVLIHLFFSTNSIISVRLESNTGDEETCNCSCNSGLISNYMCTQTCYMCMLHVHVTCACVT